MRQDNVGRCFGHATKEASATAKWLADPAGAWPGTGTSQRALCLRFPAAQCPTLGSALHFIHAAAFAANAVHPGGAIQHYIPYELPAMMAEPVQAT